MKIFTFILAFTLLAGTMTKSFAKDRKLSNGFSINLVAGIPSSTFGIPKDGGFDYQYNSKSIWGLKIGNRWYFSPTEKFGFGLMANWVDISFSLKSKIDHSSSEFGGIELSFLEVGPIGTYALTNEIALDAYYNLRPTGIIVGGLADGTTAYYRGVGFSHALGTALRYKIFNFGMELVMGGINSTPDGTAKNKETLNDQKNMTNSLRIMFGIKF